MTRRHQRWLPPAGILLALILGFIPLSEGRGGIKLALESGPYAIPGDTIVVEARITEAGAQFNAFDLVVTFDPTLMSYLPMGSVDDQRGPVMTSACSNTFHLFQPGANQAQTSLGLLCAATFVQGPGAIYRMRFVVNPEPQVRLATFTCGVGTRFYRAGVLVQDLECVNLDLAVVPVSGVPGRPDPTPESRVGRVWPNPVRATRDCLLEIESVRPGSCRIDVYDVMGRRVKELTQSMFSTGRQVISIPTTGFVPGRYFVRILQEGQVVETRGLTVIP